MAVSYGGTDGKFQEPLREKVFHMKESFSVNLKIGNTRRRVMFCCAYIKLIPQILGMIRSF